MGAVQRLGGEQDSPAEQAEAGEHTSAELAELFGVARSTVYRAIGRAAAMAPRAAR